MRVDRNAARGARALWLAGVLLGVFGLLTGCSTPARSFEDRRAAEHNRAGVESFRAGDLAAAALHFERALETARSLADRVQRCDALNNLGIVNEAIGREDAALALYEEARALAAVAPARADAFVATYWPGVLSTNLNLARLRLARGDLAGAEGALAGARSAADALGTKEARADVAKQAALGSLAQSGPSAEATELAREALRLSDGGARDPSAIARRADAGIVLGRALLAEGRLAEAADELRRAAGLARSISERALTAAALESLGEAFAVQGLYTDARIRYELALDIHARVPHAARARAALQRLSALAAAEQRPDLVERFDAQLRDLPEDR